MKLLILIICVILMTSCSEDNCTRMLNDRSEMRVEANDPLRTQAQKVFDSGIGWSNDEPSEPAEASSSIEKQVIMVKKGMSFEKAWIGFFFESFNIKHTGEFRKNYEKAVKSKLTREEWVRENTMVEYKAAQEFLTFSDTFLEPYFRSNGKSLEEIETLHFAYRASFESWMASPEDSYPWNYWGKYYDTYLKER
jgi:hypothetical protein